MSPRAPTLAAVLAALLVAAGARADEPLTYAEALARAKVGAPELAVARAREPVWNAEIGVAGTYPNPTFIAGTSSETAKFSAAVSVPLVVFGQRGASMDASRADLVTVQTETRVAWNDVRAAAAHAYVTLWKAQRIDEARAEAATLSARLDDAVKDRVSVGSSPEIEGLRSHAERIRTEADALEAHSVVAAAASELGRWLGAADGSVLRASGDPDAPNEAPPLQSLRIDASPSVLRERADAAAALAHAHKERALVRPSIAVDLGLDAGDPTLPGVNYRAQLAFDLPLFNHRGSYVEREENNAALARTRESAEKTRLSSELFSAYTRFVAVTARAKTLRESVVPAAESAATATMDAYTLGRYPLFAVLDAERARLDAKLSLLEATASRYDAWIEVEHAEGVP